MRKRLCDGCGCEIKYGIRLDSEKMYPKFYSVEVREYNGEGILRESKFYDLCDSCYSNQQ